jgi:hypothetical protein
VRLVASVALAAASVTVIAACASQPVAVRVGRTAITRAVVAHWMSLIAPEHVVPDPPSYASCVARERLLAPSSSRAALERECREQYRALERRALDFLIASAWVTETAAEDGLPISDGEVERQLREHPAPPPAEEGDRADQELVATTEVAEAKLRERLARGEPPVSAARIGSYYTEHRGRFLVPEKSYIDIENLKTRVRALTIKREVEAGRSASFTSGILHEVIEQPSPVKYGLAEQAARMAILAARPDVLSGPVFTGEYSLFEVRRIVPARYLPLGQVRDTIASQLAAEQRRLALSRFIGAWRRRWIAMTDCSPGYVVQRCRQYAGPMAPEDPLSFR